ncbi:ATPase AAA [Spirochaetia bacterium]|nr:ATPase AAA [Spirochaetia bacterium]
MVETYQPRILDRTLRELADELPAILIEGAKAVGKTSTARRLAAETLQMDNPVSRELVENSPEVLERAAKPLLIDEWQRLPVVWEYVRRQVDRNNAGGQFLLTGSAIPRDANIHSGAGRIVRLRMRPLSLAERDVAKPTVSLAALLSNTAVIDGESPMKLDDYLREILCSGFPGIRSLSSRAQEAQLDGYLDNIVSREFPDQGQLVRKPDVLRNWLRAYAAATGSTASYQAILDAATPGEHNKPAKNTTLAYRDTLESLWLIDKVEPWLPGGTSFKYLGKTPKHFLADPALSARLLDITPDRFLQGIDMEPLGSPGKTITGRLFEALAALSLKTYALSGNARLRHFRTSSGDHEVDFIIEKGKTIIAIEVKIAQTISASDLRHLHWFENQFTEYHVVKVVINSGPHAYTRKDGVHSIPLALLGP